ncbi:unnamed protein product [Porites lobata]|uniref:Uncharacterized protein n=1 Tax=Porites lobata TaxID=104759 RepID=A0ABN8NNJ7_9CNID|nr:unnamed protein product [Porites lobata]
MWYVLLAMLVALLSCPTPSFPFLSADSGERPIEVKMYTLVQTLLYSNATRQDFLLHEIGRRKQYRSRKEPQ